MATLNRTVVAGGVVYPAGTSATPELEKRIPARFWAEDEPTVEQEKPKRTPAKRKSAKSED